MTVAVDKTEPSLLRRFAVNSDEAWWRHNHEAIAADEHIGRRWMLDILRTLSKAAQPVLFHGTRYARQLLAEDRLRYSLSGYEAVSFTRSPEVATKWAYLYTGGEREKVGAVLVFDRNQLNSRFRIEPFHDPQWYDDSFFEDGAEERIWQRDVTRLSSLLIGVVWTDGLITVTDNMPTYVRTLEKLRPTRRSKRKAA